MTDDSYRSNLIDRIGVFEPLLNAIAIFILTTIILLWDASRAVYILLSLVAVAIIVRYRPTMPLDHRLYWWPILGYFGVALLSVQFNDAIDSGMNAIASRYMLLLLAGPISVMFFLGFTGKSNIWIKFVIASIAIGIVALVEIWFLDKHRADAGRVSTVFGFFAMLFATMVAASYPQLSQLRFGKILFAFAILMGIAAMLLSGNRTSLIAAVVVFFIAMNFYLIRIVFWKRALLTLALVASALALSYPLPQVKPRIEILFETIPPILAGEKIEKPTSASYRADAWRLGLMMGRDNPVLGIGPGNVKRGIEAYTEAYPELSHVNILVHIHNQFVQSFALMGLTGLLSLVLLLTCHFWIFFKYLNERYSIETRCIALAGVMLVTAYTIVSITATPFHTKDYMMLYGFISAILCGSLLGAVRESTRAQASDDDSHAVQHRQL